MSRPAAAGNHRTDGEPADQVERPTDVTETLAASNLRPELVRVPASCAWDASDVVTEIYTLHYNQLVRLAVMLVHDVQTAEGSSAGRVRGDAPGLAAAARDGESALLCTAGDRQPVTIGAAGTARSWRCTRQSPRLTSKAPNTPP